MKKILKRILNNYWKIQLLLFKFIDSNGFRIIGSLCNAFYLILQLSTVPFEHKEVC